MESCAIQTAHLRAKFTARILGSGATEGAALRANPCRIGTAGMDAGLTAPTIYYAIRQEMTRLTSAKLSGLSDPSQTSCDQSGTRCVTPRELGWTLPGTFVSNRRLQALLGGPAGTASSASGEEKWPGWSDTCRPGGAGSPVHDSPAEAIFFPDGAGVGGPVAITTSGLTEIAVGDPGALPANRCPPRFDFFYGPVGTLCFRSADGTTAGGIVLHGASSVRQTPHYRRTRTPLWAQGDMVPNAPTAARQSMPRGQCHVCIRRHSAEKTNDQKCGQNCRALPNMETEDMRILDTRQLCCQRRAGSDTNGFGHPSRLLRRRTPRWGGHLIICNNCRPGQLDPHDVAKRCRARRTRTFFSKTSLPWARFLCKADAGEKLGYFLRWPRTITFHLGKGSSVPTIGEENDTSAICAGYFRALML